MGEALGIRWTVNALCSMKVIDRNASTHDFILQLLLNDPF